MIIRSKVWMLLGVFAGLYLVALALLYIFQDRLIFQPPLGRFEDCPGLKSLGFEIAPGRLYVRQKAGAKGWLLLFHGNAESACSNLHYHQSQLADLPVNIAYAEYPGYGGDPALPSQPSLLMGALTALEHVERLNPSHLPIILMGESLGSGVATFVASRARVAALVVRSPYTSIKDVAQSIYPWVPVGLLLKHHFPADLWAQKVKIPVLAIHGRLDKTIPFALGERQARQFPMLEKFVDLPLAAHNDVWEAQEGLALKEFKEFVLRHLPLGH